MNNIDRASDIISYRQYQEAGKVNAPLNPGSVAEHLSMAGLLAPDPQIIRTLNEIDALDSETVLLESARNGEYPLSKVWQWMDSRTGKAWEGAKKDLPAVVVATGAQVRAARTALQEATE